MGTILPDIYLFNPTCEYAVANGNASWQPNRLLQKMESDLATLPLFFSKASDYVLVHEDPSHQFRDSLEKLNIGMPHFIRIDTISTNKELINQPKNKLLPWGWSPAAHKKLSPLKNNCSTEFVNSPVFDWKPHHRELYSKKFALGILKSVLSNYPSEHFISSDQVPEICSTRDDFETLLEKWGNLMVKAPWSSSGRGLQPLRKKPVHPKVWEKLMGIVKEQGCAITEPYLNKELDLAFQFRLNKGKVSYFGISNFSTDYKGQYNGNSLNGLPENLNIEIGEFATYIPQQIITPLINIIERSDLAKYYEGNFGVDTLIFRDEKGNLKINPCLEINVRQNMGLISLELEKLITPNKKGFFRTYYDPGISFQQFKIEMEKKHPLILNKNKIESGFLALTDAKKEAWFGGYILI